MTRIIQFRYDDGRTNLAWSVGDNVDPDVHASFYITRRIKY